MAIAFSAIVPVEQRCPANPVATKGNALYVRQFRVVIPISTTVATLVLGQLPPGTLVVGAVIDTDTTLGAATLALATSESIFVAASVQTVVGGEQKTIAANKGVAVKSSTAAPIDLTLALATASSPASEVTVDVTLVLSSIAIEAGYPTFTA